MAEDGLGLRADKVILCAGGTNRLLPVPGAELLGSHRDAWSLADVPDSLLVVGAGATGAQVASVFAELGSHVLLFEAGPRILATEDEDVSRVMADCFRASGIDVREGFGRFHGFEKSAVGVRMRFGIGDRVESVEAAVAVAAIGWLADTVGLNLNAAGVATTPRAVELTQVASVAIAAGMTVEQIRPDPALLSHLHQRPGTSRVRCRPAASRARLLGRTRPCCARYMTYPARYARLIRRG